jgi:hypothetical protein
MPYRVVRTPIRRTDGQTFGPGDVIEPTDAELQAFGDNLEPVDDGGADDADDAATPDDDNPDADQSGTEICGTEQSDGSICDRPADECPYH